MTVQQQTKSLAHWIGVLKDERGRIPKQPPKKYYRLSRSQERLWFDHLHYPLSCAFNELIELELEGPLDRSILRQSLLAIIRRHDALRTTFVEIEGKPLQRIARDASVDITFVDLAGLDTEIRTGCRATLLDQQLWRPFDLEHGPLIRIALLISGATRHELIISTHHIVCDALSSLVLLKELKELYAAATCGAPGPREPEMSYVDFAE